MPKFATSNFFVKHCQIQCRILLTILWIIKGLQLDLIDISLKNNKAVFGSLVVTNKATFFISIGLGKINIKSNDFFIISLDSPIGMIIKNKTINKSFQLRGVDYKIKNIE